MQKLFNRVGTQQHKYRLALHFTNMMVHSLNNHGAYYRIMLQRGSKQYTSNYLTIQPSVQNPINETIQVKATMFYDVAKAQYQEKKFDILILRKDFKDETVVGRFSLSAENCLRFRGQQSVFKDHMNKLEVRIYCQRIDSNQGYRDTSMSDRSSVTGSIDTKFRVNDRSSIRREAMPMIPSYPNRISTDSRQEEFRRSVVDQFRIEDSRQKMGQLPQFPQITPQHLPQQPQMQQMPALANSNISSPRPVSPQLTMPVHQQYKPYQELRPNSPPLPPISQTYQAPNQAYQVPNQPYQSPNQPAYANPYTPPQPPMPIQNPYQLPQSPTKAPMESLSQNFRVSITPAYETQMQMVPQYPPFQPTQQKVPSFKSLDIDKDKVPVNRKVPRVPSPPPRPPKQQVQFCSQITAVDSQVIMKPKEQAIVFTPLQDKAQVKQSYMSATFKNPPDFDFSLSSQLERKNHNITQLTQNFKLILERQRQKHQYQRQRHKLELQRQRDRFNLDLERQRHKFDIQKQNHRYELQRHRKSEQPRHQIEIDRYKQELQQYKQQLDTTIKKHRQQIDTINGANRNQLLKMQQKHTSAQAYYLQEIKKIRQSSLNTKQQEIARLVQQHHQKQAILQQQLQQMIQNAKNQSNNSHTLHQQQIQNLITIQQQQINNIQKLNQQKHQAYIVQINRISDQLTHKHKQIANLTEQVALRQQYIKQREQTIDKLNIKLVKDNQSFLRQIDQLEKFNTQKTFQMHKLNKVNETIKSDMTFLGQQHNTLNALHQDLKIELSRAVNQINSIKNIVHQRDETISGLNLKMEQLHMTNNQLSEKIVQLSLTIQQQQQQLSSKSPQLLRLNRQYQRLSIENRNSIGQMEQLRSDRELMGLKQLELMNKCQQLEERYKKKQEQFQNIVHKIRQMEFTMVNPEEDPNYQHNKEQLKRLQTVIEQLNQNISAKDKEINMLNQKLNNTHNLLSQTVRLWTVKENSMVQAMAAKDKRLLELEREGSCKSQVTVKYGMAEQDKQQLLLKISALNCEIDRLREVEDEMAVTEAMNRDLQIKIRHLYAENEGLKSQLDLNNYVKGRPYETYEQQDAVNQLTRANSRIAQMLQYVYRQNPMLARQLAQIKPSSYY